MNLDETPFFSIVTPVLNGEPFIRQYVQTLKSQTFQQWEAIVIDDGSNDGSFDIFCEYALADSRFKILLNNCQRSIRGPYQARNLGIDSAVGQFICFLDVDDMWLENKLKNQYESITLNSDYLLLLAPYYRAPSGDLRKSHVRHPPDISLLYLCSKFANPIPMLTSCIRKDVLTGIRFLPVRHEDFIFWSQVLQNIEIKNIFISAFPLAVYRIDANSLSGNKLMSIKWIWICYRYMGYSAYFSVVSIFVRGMIQFCYYVDMFLSGLRRDSAKFIVH